MLVNKTALYRLIWDIIDSMPDAWNYKVLGKSVDNIQDFLEKMPELPPAWHQLDRYISGQPPQPLSSAGRTMIPDPIYSLFYKDLDDAIIWVLDLTPVTFPQWHQCSRYYTAAFERLVKSRCTIITISESTRLDLLVNYPISPDRVKVLPLYPPKLDHFISSQQDDSTIPVGLKYFLFVGSMEIRKNIRGMINAFNVSGLAEKGWCFYLAGGGNCPLNPATDRGVKHWKKCSDSMLKALYTHASGFFYASFWEGFGMPLLEAMHYGIPCIASDSGATPEVGGDACIYCDAVSCNSMANALIRLANLSQEQRSELIKRGNARLEVFSYENYQRKLRNIIKELQSQPLKHVFSPIRISEKEAVESGYDELFIPHGGLGDAIMISVVAEKYYREKGKKMLISHKNYAVLENNPYLLNLCGYEDGRITSASLKKLISTGIKPNYPSYWNYSYSKIHRRMVFTYPNTHIIARICERIGLSGKIKICPKIYLSDEEKLYGRFFHGIQIAVMGSGICSHKDWGHSKMQELVDKMSAKYHFVQVGTKEDQLLRGALDMRGILSLRQIAALMYNSDMFLGSIGGLMHMARAVNCPAVIAYSSAEAMYYDSYTANINVGPTDQCNLCRDLKINPYFDPCPHNFKCIRTVSVIDVINAIEKMLARPLGQLDADMVELKPEPVLGIELYSHMHCLTLSESVF